MAAYGAQLEQGKSDEEAIAYLKRALPRARPRPGQERPRGARRPSPAARATSCSPTRTRRSSPSRPGEELDYVVPDQTILIENPVAVVNTTENPEAAQAFVDYLYTPEAQAIFASKGYRPVVEGVDVRVRLPRARPASSRSPTSAAGPTSASASSTARRASSSTSRTSWECPLTTSPEAVSAAGAHWSGPGAPAASFWGSRPRTSPSSSSSRSRRSSRRRSRAGWPPSGTR